MDSFIYTKAGMAVALVVVIGLVCRLLFNRDKDSASKVNFDDLFLGDDGKMSKAAIVMIGSFLMTTWIMVHLTMIDKMSEGYLTIYGGLWIIPVVTKLIKGSSDASQSP